MIIRPPWSNRLREEVAEQERKESFDALAAKLQLSVVTPDEIREVIEEERLFMERLREVAPFTAVTDV